MNIQIFSTKKCKAQRCFKERGIKFQFIDMSEKEIGKGKFRSVCQAVGGINAMINENCKKVAKILAESTDSEEEIVYDYKLVPEIFLQYVIMAIDIKYYFVYNCGTSLKTGGSYETIFNHSGQKLS